MQKLKIFTSSVIFNIILILIIIGALAYVIVQPDLSYFQGSSFTIPASDEPIETPEDTEESMIGAVVVEYFSDDSEIEIDSNSENVSIAKLNFNTEYEGVLVNEITFEVEGLTGEQVLKNLRVLEVPNAQFSWEGVNILKVQFVDQLLELKEEVDFELIADIQNAEPGAYILVHFVNLKGFGNQTNETITNVGVLGGPNPLPKKILIINN
ncbi:hypothetical protein ACFL10_00885 [Patescibacteria group bacterium]